MGPIPGLNLHHQLGDGVLRVGPHLAGDAGATCIGTTILAVNNCPTLSASLAARMPLAAGDAVASRQMMGLVGLRRLAADS